MMKKIYLAIIALTIGCSASFEEAKIANKNFGYSKVSSKKDDYCRNLDDSRIMWGAYSKIAGSLSGVSGISSVPVDNRDLKIALQLSSVSLAAFAVGALIIEEEKSVTWVRDCSK